jgi:uncharacterized protein (TIGR02598 family)
MEKSVPSVPSFKTIRTARSRAGFSLVEVTLAIGIMAFAFVAIFGLIPVGLTTFSKAKNISIADQIAQRLITEFEQQDFNTLVPVAQATPNNTFLAYGAGGRQYDERGQWGGDPNLPAAQRAATTIYWVNVRIMPATPVPKRGTSVGGTTSPGDNSDVAMVTIQVAYNPALRNLAFSYGDGSANATSTQPLRNLWSGAYKDDTANPPNTRAVPILTYSTYIARNQYQ